MKIGMIFESGPQGADKQVCEHLAQRVLPKCRVVPVTHRNKREMIADCGKDVLNLFDEGCDRILIVWDLFPPWRPKGEKPCRRKDREAIANSLKQAGIKGASVYLICIKEELEAWLLADGRALSAVLSTSAHSVRVKDEKRPDDIRKPKTRLMKIFQEHRRWPYNDMIHAQKIIRALPDLNRIRRSESFRRFENKLK